MVGWAGWPFHAAAALNLVHGNATMDTLISLGTLAALGWSVYALLFGAAGEIGYTHPFEFRLVRHGATANLYLEAAVGITTFLLLGRYLEVRAKRRSGAALRALLDLPPTTVDGAAGRPGIGDRGRPAAGRRRVRGRAGGNGSRPTGSSSAVTARSTRRA